VPQARHMCNFEFLVGRPDMNLILVRGFIRPSHWGVAFETPFYTQKKELKQTQSPPRLLDHQCPDSNTSTCTSLTYRRPNYIFRTPLKRFRSNHRRKATLRKSPVILRRSLQKSLLRKVFSRFCTRRMPIFMFIPPSLIGIRGIIGKGDIQWNIINDGG